ncbi:MAG: ArsR/SmtB family transcription factor [Candidatus Thorarchaeota archaeon]|jgi:DNA-binding transcriptional ArsR family regulator
MSSSSSRRGEVLVKGDEIHEVVKIFKALSDHTRIQIISTLTQKQRYNVSELASTLDMDISRVSHQLTKLEDMGFIRHTREGRNIYYELQDKCIRTILKTAKDHVSGK